MLKAQGVGCLPELGWAILIEQFHMTGGVMVEAVLIYE